MAITFDPTNRRIILDSASVTPEVIFSRWEDWMVSGDNAKYLPAFAHVGGNELGGGLYIPNYFFLLNGWRVRPMEVDHTLTITGNLFTSDGSTPVVRTAGPYQVNVNYTVPVQAQGIATSGSTGPSAADVAAEVVAQIMATFIPADIRRVNGVDVSGTGTEFDPWGPE